MQNCRRVTDFEKSPLFYISRRNAVQREPITTRPISVCYQISLSCSSSAHVKKRGDFSKSVPVWQLGIFPNSFLLSRVTRLVLNQSSRPSSGTKPIIQFRCLLLNRLFSCGALPIVLWSSSIGMELFTPFDGTEFGSVWIWLCSILNAAHFENCACRVTELLIFLIWIFFQN